MTGDDLPLALSRLLEREPDIGFAYLFGSFAKGRTHPHSDIDVAVWFDESVDSFERALQLQATLQTHLKREVDVVALNNAPSALRHNVLQHGHLVLSRDDATRRRFYVSHGQAYFDMAPARNLFMRAMIRRIEQGTFGGGTRHRP